MEFLMAVAYLCAGLLVVSAFLAAMVARSVLEAKDLSDPEARVLIPVAVLVWPVVVSCLVAVGLCSLLLRAVRGLVARFQP